MPPRIWNIRRQLLGNLVPLLFGIAAGLVFFKLALVVRVVIGIAAGILGVNLWGFYENKKIDRELRNLTRSEGELIGFVYKVPAGMLDAHAEIGILSIDDDQLQVVTEKGGIVLRRDDIVGLNRRRNIHSILFLGGWIVLELKNGSDFRFESRMFNTMHMSKLRTDQLFLELALWQAEKSPA